MKHSRETTGEVEPRVDPAALRRFISRVFQCLGVPVADADSAAEVLVASDLRGVESHGAAHMPRYVEHLRTGRMRPVTRITTVAAAPTTLVLDGGGGLGFVAARHAMERCIEMASVAGCASVAVRNSNHYGIAAYYAMMALEHDMIGLSFTNTRGHAPPTFGRSLLLGTNPVAVAVPAGAERPFVLDMATTTVAYGKLEVARDKGEHIPLGWAVDGAGRPTDDPAVAMQDGGLLPLGGSAEHAGYKGYGLSMLVDILCGVLAGAATTAQIEQRMAEGGQPTNTGHFFMALRCDSFRPLGEFKAEMDILIRTLRGSPRASDADRIYVAGEKEFESAERYRREGIPLHRGIVAALQEVAADLGLEYDL